MGLFDKIGAGIEGALEGLGRTAGTLLEGLAPIATQALGARVAEKLGPRGAMPGTLALPGAFPVARQPTQLQAPIPNIFEPRGGPSMAQNPFGSGPFLPPAMQASLVGPLIRQLPGVIGGVAGGAAVESALDLLPLGRGAGRMPGGIAMNSLFRRTPSGRLSAERVAFMEDGEGRGAFFVNAGVPKTWSKVTLKKRRTCSPR